MILLPGRVPGFKRDDIQLLLSAVTKREVWIAYREATAQCEGAAVVCYSLFCQLWRQLTPQVVVSKPMSDLCSTCQKNSSLIMRAHNRPVEEKTEVCKYTTTCIKQQPIIDLSHCDNTNMHLHKILFLQAVKRAEDHLVLVTQERSVNKCWTREGGRCKLTSCKRESLLLHHYMG